jgi:hypothetical protein
VPAAGRPRWCARHHLLLHFRRRFLLHFHPPPTPPRSLDDHYTPGAAKAAYRRFALRLLHPLADRLGYAAKSGEDSNVEILRASLERAQGIFGDAAVIGWAKRTLADHSGSAADHRTALNVVAGQADASTFDSLLAQAEAEQDPLYRQQ